MFLGNCKQLDIARPKGSEIAGSEASEPVGVYLAKLRIPNFTLEAPPCVSLQPYLFKLCAPVAPNYFQFPKCTFSPLSALLWLTNT